MCDDAAVASLCHGPCVVHLLPLSCKHCPSAGISACNDGLGAKRAGHEHLALMSVESEGAEKLLRLEGGGWQAGSVGQ